MTVTVEEPTITPTTLFDVVNTNVLTSEHLHRLTAGLVAAVRVREFFTPAQCAEIMAALDGAATSTSTYGSQGAPTISKLGPSAYDIFTLNQDTYWPEAARAAELRSTLLAGADPFALAQRKLAEAWRGPVRPARCGGREMYAGVIREINNGALMHFDEIVREMPGVVDELPVAQLAFNCHLSAPERGGETSVFRRRWRPADERFRDGYGYQPQIVAGEPSARVRADAGDAVLFDSRNFHLVEAARGRGRRVCLAFFIGLTGAGELIVWS